MVDSEHAARVPDYRRLRGRLVALQQLIVNTLTAELMDEAATRTGLLGPAGSTIKTPYELSVLVDFAIYDVRHHGRTPVERFVAGRAGKLDPEGRQVLAAMAEQRYTILRVVKTEPGAGLAVVDLLGGPTTFLFDLGLSQTATPGWMLVSRLVAPDGITMTTGAGLPLGVMPDDRVATFQTALEQDGLRRMADGDPAKRSEMTEALITLALKSASQAIILSQDVTDPSSPILAMSLPDDDGRAANSQRGARPSLPWRRPTGPKRRR